MSRVEWNGRECKRHYHRKTVQFLRVAALTVERRAKELLSAPGTLSIKGKKRVYGYFRSARGEPPRKQTGRLRASVATEVDEANLTARVGTNLFYGRILELGLGKLRGAARPWLRRALAESKSKIEEASRRIMGDTQ